jgi:hypothetical protein
VPVNELRDQGTFSRMATLQRPDAATGTTTAVQNTGLTRKEYCEQTVTDKKGFGARWLFSPRMIDNLLADGLPHCKVGKRRVRIIIDEADHWMRARYGTQRRGQARQKKEAA